MTSYSSLELKWAERSWSGGWPARRFLDLVVNQQSLREALGQPDFIGGIGWGAHKAQKMYADRLLLRAPTNVPSGRVALLICPECGDIGCGAFTARVGKTDTSVTWSDFAFENDYDPDATRRIEGLGPFIFERTSYWKVLDGARKNIGQKP